MVKFVNSSCEWPNSQLDPPLVTSLCRMVVIHSMALHVIRHGRKSVASHSFIQLFFYLKQTSPCHTGNTRQWHLGCGSVAYWSQTITDQSEVGRKCTTAGRPRLWFWARVYADRLTNDARGSPARKSVVLGSQATLIACQLYTFVFSYVSRFPTSI